MIPPTLKAMLNVYRKIDIINSKKLYMKYFNHVNSSMFKIKLKISSQDKICKKRLILSEKIKDERKRKKFLNLTKKLVQFYADQSQALILIIIRLSSREIVGRLPFSFL